MKKIKILSIVCLLFFIAACNKQELKNSEKIEIERLFFETLQVIKEVSAPSYVIESKQSELKSDLLDLEHSYSLINENMSHYLDDYEYSRKMALIEFSLATGNARLSDLTNEDYRFMLSELEELLEDFSKAVVMEKIKVKEKTNINITTENGNHFYYVNPWLELPEVVVGDTVIIYVAKQMQDNTYSVVITEDNLNMNQKPL